MMTLYTGNKNHSSWSMRPMTCGVPVPPAMGLYMQSLSAVAAWRRDALAEDDFRAFNKPYHTRPQA